VSNFIISLGLHVKVRHDEVRDKTIVGLTWPGFNLQGIKINGIVESSEIRKAIEKLMAEDKLHKANQLLQEYVN